MTVSYPANGIQNGAPDGIALVDGSGSLVQFLSYEGSFTPVNGPAAGVTSADIGVSESSGTPTGQSLQLSGNGRDYESFTWNDPASSTFGACNTGQSFGDGVVGPLDPVINEFVFNHTGSDSHEFVEIYGEPNGNYSAFALLVLEGDEGGNPGQISQAYYLDATDGEGFWDSGYLSNALQNRSQTLLLVENFTSGPGVDLDGDDDGTLDITPWDRVVDGVAVSDGDSDDHLYGQPVLMPGYDGVSFTVGGASRIPDGADSDSAGDWVRNSFDGAGLDGFTAEGSEGAALNTRGVSNRVYAALADVVINEVDADTPGSDSAEFVELFDGGTGNSSLDALVVVFYNGNGDSVYVAHDLDGYSTDAAGYFVLGNSGVNGVVLTFGDNGLQNGADAVALYQGDAGDFPSGPVATPTFTAVNLRPDQPVLPHNGDLRVASFNVLNYFNGPTFPTSRGADTVEEFQRQQAKIVSAILGLDSDIIGLMEIENDGYGPGSAIANLVSALNTAAGAGSYAFVDPAVARIGSDEIAVGLIYRPAAVAPLGGAAILDSSVDPDFIDTKNRPALAQTFRELDDDAVLTVVVNHFKSKGSSCDSIGDPDTGDGSGNCNLTRTRAAEALVDWLAGDPTGSGDEDFLILGDLNSYAQEDPIDALKAAGYTDLIWQYHGQSAYSYIFDGASGYLDYALSSPNLTDQVTGVTEWHINTDEPAALDYDTTFKSDAQDVSLYDPGPYRASDHDPVIVELDLTAAAMSGDLDGDSDVDRADLMQLMPLLNQSVAADDPRDLDGDGRVTVIDLRRLVLMCSRPRCAP